MQGRLPLRISCPSKRSTPAPRSAQARTSRRTTHEAASRSSRIAAEAGTVERHFLRMRRKLIFTAAVGSGTSPTSHVSGREGSESISSSFGRGHALPALRGHGWVDGGVSGDGLSERLGPLGHRHRSVCDSRRGACDGGNDVLPEPVHRRRRWHCGERDVYERHEEVGLTDTRPQPL